MKNIYKLRGFLAAIPIVFAFFQPIQEEYIYWGWGLGAGIFTLGVLIRIWGIQNLHYRIKTKKILTTTGPYQFVRNPLYIGNTSMCVGAVFFSCVFWLVGATIVYSLVLYTLVICYEESHLKEKYGEMYLEYCKKIPRWFPRIPAEREPMNFYTTETLTTLKVELPAFLLVLPFILKFFFFPDFF